MPLVLFVFAGIASLNLVGVTLQLDLLEWLTKPLLAPVLALYLWQSAHRRHAAVLAGLAFATAGDVFLLLPGEGAFFTGIACFLGTQLCYITAFVRRGAGARLRARPLLGAGFLVAWAAINAALLPRVGPLAWAVAPYSAALVTMTATACVMGRTAAWGGVLFLGSDLLIGLGAAGAEFTGRQTLVMATYVVAQFLLVHACVRAPAVQGPDPGGQPSPGHTAPEAGAGGDTGTGRLPERRAPVEGEGHPAGHRADQACQAGEGSARSGS
ncbi:lysoplasmalogenase [Streptomyces sp. NPDC086080]|uniref:lysoplasmalogenase n=1 Tax=Streptomyces sp. NPDC086080 TaxID=3365748 RepID=UPI0037D3CB3A